MEFKPFVFDRDNRLPGFPSSAPRYLIADEAAKRIFFTYLS